MTFRILAVPALACALLTSACMPKDGAGPGTSATGYGQIAIGLGQVIGRTKYDAQVAKAGEQLARYCGALQAVAVGASIFAPAKHQAVATQAAAAVTAVCADPPEDVASALVAAARAYEAVLAAGKAAGVAVPAATGA